MIKIDLPHKILDYSCPINGLEDQYEWKTGNRLPGFFLMDVSSIGFIYIKQLRAPAPRMTMWGSGMGKNQYEFLTDVIGFKVSQTAGKSFRSTWKIAKTQLDQGIPVIIGLVDMFHLPYYEKFYHRYHIPQHFLQLVGYDENTDSALVQDNSLPGIQSVPLNDFQPAWNVHNPGQGIPNTLYTFQFDQHIADISDIVHKGLKKRAQVVLNPPVGFMGIRGMRRMGADFAKWSKELTDSQLIESLRFLATFTCSVVPNPPQQLLPFPLGYSDPHQAIRDRFSTNLSELSGEYSEPHWRHSADLLKQSGVQIGKLTDAVVTAILGDRGMLQDVPELMNQIANLEEEAFSLLS